MRRPFHIVDVFAESPYTGNQLAVVEDDGSVSTAEMQSLAREMAYSETTFLTPEPTEDGWPVRIFTPESEIPFAGHPTLGTAHVIREQYADERAAETVLDLPVGQVPVREEDVDGRETLWMTQQPPTFGAELSRSAVAAAVSLSTDALDEAYPVQIVSTGLPTIVVPLSDLDALKAAGIDHETYDALTGDREAKNILVFSPEAREPENDLAVRMFAPGLGVLEDPATGSSNGCLAAYLARHRYFDDPSIAVDVDQGHEIDRPSRLHLRARDTDETVQVEVGGRVEPVADGSLR